MLRAVGGGSDEARETKQKKRKMTRRAAARLVAPALLLSLLFFTALASSKGESGSNSKDSGKVGSYSACEAAALFPLKAALKERGPRAALSEEEGRGVSDGLRACHGVGGGSGGGGAERGNGGGL